MRRPLGTHSHVYGATTYCYLPISNAALMIAEQPRSSSFQALDAARKAIYRITTTMTMVCQADGTRTSALLGRMHTYSLSAAEWRLLHGWELARSWPPVPTPWHGIGRHE